MISRAECSAHALVFFVGSIRYLFFQPTSPLKDRFCLLEVQAEQQKKAQVEQQNKESQEIEEQNAAQKDFLYSVLLKAKKQGDMAPFNPRYADIRSRKLFSWFPLGLGASVIFIYVRSIYRVAELSEGWSGHLIAHEIYFMILDALMMCLAIIIMIPFHPGFVFGRNAYIPVKGMKLGIRDEDKATRKHDSDEKGPSDEESRSAV